MSRRLKTVLLAAMLLFPLVLEAQERSDKNSTGQDTLIFSVYGMDCPGCERGLEKQIDKIPAVSGSKASWVNQRLKVVVKKDSVLNQEDVAFRVKKANFTLAETEVKKKK